MKALIVIAILAVAFTADARSIYIYKERVPDREYYQSTGKGTLQKTREYPGYKVNDQWKYQGGKLIKERKVTPDKNYKPPAKPTAPEYRYKIKGLD